MPVLPVNICRVNTPDGVKEYVTYLHHETAFEKGICPEAVIGVVLEPIEEFKSITPEIFVKNSVFVNFMHEVIGRCGPNTHSFIAEAKRLRNGWVYVIDQRTPSPNGNVPPEDIIGGFEVKKGKVMDGSYRANPNHLILSTRGFVQLGTELHSYLLEELSKRI